jgi:glyoxylase I family protein
MPIHHTAISVKNSEASKAFYESLFGMVQVATGERPELEVKFIVLKDEKGNKLELFEHSRPESLDEDLMDFQKIGIKHISFEVENIEKIMEGAVKLGSKIIWPPQKAITVKRIAFISDPDNIPIELMEV